MKVSHLSLAHMCPFFSGSTKRCLAVSVGTVPLGPDLRVRALRVFSKRLFKGTKAKTNPNMFHILFDMLHLFFSLVCLLTKSVLV